MKNALTLTLVAGTRACPNDCPICISKMTNQNGVDYQKIPINIDALRHSIQIALNHNTQNVLITGKGEPTLYPGQICQYLIEMKGKPFDKRELQTEGSNISRKGMDDFLETWKALDLNFIAISIFHYDSEKNQNMFKNTKGYDIPKLIKKLIDFKFNIRLSCVLTNGNIDNQKEVSNLIRFAKDNGVMQLSLRTVDVPRKTLNSLAADETIKHRINNEKYSKILNYIKSGTICDKLPHGAEVYEVDGQNVCITTGLTADAGKDDIRQLIFFPQGILTGSWETVQGSRII